MPEPVRTVARTRSRKHVLHMAADRLEREGRYSSEFDPKVPATLRNLAATLDKNWTEEDEKRVDRQRTLFGMLPSSNATDRLKEAMLQRAYDLMWDGDTDGADALIEFLPSMDAEKMMDAWLDDQGHSAGVSKKPLSKWYGS